MRAHQGLGGQAVLLTRPLELAHELALVDAARGVRVDRTEELLHLLLLHLGLCRGGLKRVRARARARARARVRARAGLGFRLG